MKTDLTRIHIELASARSVVTQDAVSLLHAFGHSASSQERADFDPTFFMRYLLEADGKSSRIVCVGYLGDIATCAATVCKDVRPPSDFDGPEAAPFNNVPYLGVLLIASDKAYRRQSHCSQLVAAITNLAAEVNFDRVQAIWPSDDEARAFWSRCGFKDVPFETTFLDMSKPATPFDLSPGVHSVDPAVIERLTSEGKF